MKRLNVFLIFYSMLYLKEKKSNIKKDEYQCLCARIDRIRLGQLDLGDGEKEDQMARYGQ